MVDFWGLWASALTVAVGIVGVGIMVWYELRKQNSKFKEAKDELNNMNRFLQSITVGQIHEKIAILNNTVTEIPSWKSEDVEYKRNKMSSDVRVISEIRPFLTAQQREQLRVLKERLTQALNNHHYDTAELNAVFGEIFPT
jgi:cell division protein ZapA (FtsZ GTPase activity inhibitor)